MANLKKTKGLQVHIVEPHNDAVPAIHRAIASRVLPFSCVAMVHLDSHPDLLLPVHMQADTVFKPQELYESLSIENWILPLVYAKHLDHIVWVKPPWAQQIPVSKQRFFVGQCLQSGSIRVTSKENYFLTDGLFRPALEISNPSFVTLQVEQVLPKHWADLDPTYNSVSDEQNPEQCGTWINHILDSIKDKPYVLDIDLDFFSTANPFRDLLEPEAEKALRMLYSYTSPTEFSDESIARFTECREKQLNLLEDIFSELEAERVRLDCDQTCVLTAELFSATLDKARDLGLTEERIQDLQTLCNTVVHHSLANSRAVSEKSPSLDHNLAGPNLAVHPTSFDPGNSHPTSNSSSLSSKEQTQLTSCDESLKEQTQVTSCDESSKEQTQVTSYKGPSNGASDVGLSQASSSHVIPVDLSQSECLTFLQLHDFGCTLDDTELPHHLSSQSQVVALMSEFKVMLESLPRPALVTIARSSDDGYCPKEDVDMFERDVLKMLDQVFGSLDITKHYDC